MTSPTTYGQLRSVLTKLGFRETRRPNGVALEHQPTDTLFLFRRYEDHDAMQSAEVVLVAKQLDERGLLEPDRFKTLLVKAPA